MKNMEEMHAVILRNVLVKMSDRSLIQGKVNVPDQHRRLSDWFGIPPILLLWWFVRNLRRIPGSFYR